MQGVKGLWSMAATYAVIVVASIFVGPQIFSGWKELGQDMLDFFSGRLLSSSNAKNDLFVALPESLAALVIDIPIAAVLAFGARAIFRGNGKRSSSLPSTERKKRATDIFKKVFLVITLEEVFARWLFLGVLWPWLGGGVAAFYILFLLGNGIWALIHLRNWADEDPHPTWVLPQFWGGILLTILYVKHGFAVALLAHFAYDCILFCAMAKQKFDLFDLIHVALGVGYVGLGHLFISQNPSDALGWFTTRETIALEGWGLWDYIMLPLILAGWSAIVFGLLGYDQSGTSQSSDNNRKTTVSSPGLFLAIIALFLVLGPLVVIGANYVVFWLSTKFTASVPIAAMAAGIVWTFQKHDESLSAMCRTFWASVPLAIVFMCSLQALTVWQGYIFMWATAVLMAPIEVMAQAARQT